MLLQQSIQRSLRLTGLSQSLMKRQSIWRPIISGSLRSFSNFPKGVDVLDDPTSLKCSIKKFGKKAFLVNNVNVSSSLILFPNFYLQWRVKKIEDLTIEDLHVFTLLHPSVQILIIGCGGKLWGNRPKMLEISAHMRQLGIAVEFLTTNQAAATFNVLNSEGRDVAAALVTIEPITDTEEEELVFEPPLPSAADTAKQTEKAL
eukprot:gene7370-7948_t